MQQAVQDYEDSMEQMINLQIDGKDTFSTGDHPNLPDFVTEFPTVFPPADQKQMLPPLRGFEIDHQIYIDKAKLPEFKPGFVPMAPAHKLHFRKLLDEWFAAGIAVARHGLTPSPTFSVAKKDGSIRWVYDFRARNKITIRDHTAIS